MNIKNLEITDLHETERIEYVDMSQVRAVIQEHRAEPLLREASSDD